MSRRKSWVARLDREAAARRKQLAAEARDADKKADRAWAQRQVSAFEAQCDYLLSMHKECGPVWNWVEISQRSPPNLPIPDHVNKEEARSARDEYVPSLFDKLFLQVKRKKTQLEQNVAAGVRQDAASNQRRISDHQQQLERYQWETRIARGILQGSLPEYNEALEGICPFSELSEAQVSVTVPRLLPEAATLVCFVDPSVLPKEEKKLNASGKLNAKLIAPTTKWSLYEEFVAACALRVAREVFALLPLKRTVVNVAEKGIDLSTGQPAVLTLLAVSIERGVIEGFNFDTLQPVTCLRNLPSRMNFKKSTGFEAVEAMTDEETFMTMSRAR